MIQFNKNKFNSMEIQGNLQLCFYANPRPTPTLYRR